MPVKLVWLALFFVLWAVVFLVVPRDRIVNLLLPSFLGGTVVALVVNLIGASVLGLWRFPVALVPVLGIPLFFLLAYMPAMLLFLHYWDHLPGGSTEKVLYLITFSLANTVLAYFALSLGYVVFIRWNLLYFFLLALALYGLVALLFFAPGVRAVLRKI